jgi:hypothetical protein
MADGCVRHPATLLALDERAGVRRRLDLEVGERVVGGGVVREVRLVDQHLGRPDAGLGLVAEDGGLSCEIVIRPSWW